jgi:hypothetical protein
LIFRLIKLPDKKSNTHRYGHDAETPAARTLDPQPVAAE